jgi:hypothetical protein
MTLADVTLPIPLSEARALSLVFTLQLAGRLAELHSLYGTTNCIPVPQALADGRLVLSADLLTEVMPGGLLHAMWAAADQSILLPSVEVVLRADAAAMLPPPPEDPAQ